MKSIQVAIKIKINPAIAADLCRYARFRNVPANHVMRDAVSCVFDVLESMEVLHDLPRYTDQYLETVMASDKSFQRWKKNRGASIVPATHKKTGKAAKKPASTAAQQ
jgi:hypothetical protein